MYFSFFKFLALPRGMTPVVFRSDFAFWSHWMLLASLAHFLPRPGINSYSKSPGFSGGKWYLETTVGVQGAAHCCCGIISSRHFRFILIENWLFAQEKMHHEFISYFQFKFSSEFLLL